MLKNKNIAKVMAATTVLTAAAPMTQVFAAQGRAVIGSNQEQEIKELKQKVYELLNTRYTDNYALIKGTEASKSEIAGSLVYIVKIAINDGNAKTVTSYSEFEKEFDKLFASLKNGEKITVTYESKYGFNELDNGEIVDCIFEKFDTTRLTNLNSNPGGLVNQIFEYLGGKSTCITLADKSLEGKLPISNGEFLSVKEGDTYVSRSKPKFKVVDGYYVDNDNNPVKLFVGSEVMESKTIDELMELDAVIEGYYPALDVASVAKQDKGTYAIVKSAQAETQEDLTVSDLYDASITRLTVKGNEIRKAIKDVIADETPATPDPAANEDNLKFEIIAIDNAGKETVVVDSEKAADATKIANTIKIYGYTNAKSVKIIFSTIADEIDAKLEWAPVYEATITEGRNEDFAGLFKALATDATVQTLAGEDRYKTAVEVSKATYNAKTRSTTDTVVLVSGEASKLVDGLTATPLASTLNAPVLLTQANAINKDTLNEIKRLGAKNVIIVGGKNSIEESVAVELDKVHGLNVTRLGGDSRYDTSMAVANKIAALKTIEGQKSAEFERVFVVGGNGEADALSVSAIAAEEGAPILLTPADKLDADVKYYINKNVVDDNDEADVYIVGGTNSVKPEVQAALVDINVINQQSNKIEVKRLSGLTRQDTNAAVITEFAGNLKDIVVAKSDNNGMVDALAAGVYAAEKDSHIVLATNELTEAQEDAIAKVKKTNTTNTDTLVQAGYNVAKDVVAKVLNLIK